jgi:hypothetical protein
LIAGREFHFLTGPAIPLRWDRGGMPQVSPNLPKK